MAGGEQPGATEFASDLVRVLIDMGRAEFEDPERSQYNRAVWSFAQEQGKAWESWDKTQWSLDGHAIPARTWRFAHFWTGMTLGVPDHYVGVTAFDLEDPGVDLVEVSGSDYGFDFTVPFGIRGLEVEHAGQPDTSEIFRSQSRHLDHDRVLAFQDLPGS